ncbi:MAG: HEAT repeat domain-containing protein [Planctomycetes bacterium]|nr:HEAT repeat domain-containing protein [Planctomycetota bacterium]
MTWGRQCGAYVCLGAGIVMACAAGGCAGAPVGGGTDRHLSLRQRAGECLKAAVAYPHNPAVRVQAVEALRGTGDIAARPWIRTALLDEHPAVRFAGCVAVGELRDAGAEDGVRVRLDDPDASVRAAAFFAMHRLGRKERSGKLTALLFDHPDPLVRRNAALLLGLLEERGAVKVLARAMQDSDAGVRNQVLEALARLGSREAGQELTFLANSGVGADEVFAIQALTATRDARYLETFRYKFETGTHLETRLAAARGLALHGVDAGFTFAMRALTLENPVVTDSQDTPEGRQLRVRQLAAAVLGATHRAQALHPLARLMDNADDPRVQVAAARAILEILGAEGHARLPFAADPPTRRR